MVRLALATAGALVLAVACDNPISVSHPTRPSGCILYNERDGCLDGTGGGAGGGGGGGNRRTANCDLDDIWVHPTLEAEANLQVSLYCQQACSARASNRDVEAQTACDYLDALLRAQGFGSAEQACLACR